MVAEQVGARADEARNTEGEAFKRQHRQAFGYRDIEADGGARYLALQLLIRYRILEHLQEGDIERRNQRQPIRSEASSLEIKRIHRLDRSDHGMRQLAVG